MLSQALHSPQQYTQLASSSPLPLCVTSPNNCTVSEQMIATETILKKFMQPDEEAPNDNEERVRAKAKGLVKKLFNRPAMDEDNNFVPGHRPIVCTPPASPFSVPDVSINSSEYCHELIHLNFA